MTINWNFHELEMQELHGSQAYDYSGPHCPDNFLPSLR